MPFRDEAHGNSSAGRALWKRLHAGQELRCRFEAVATIGKGVSTECALGPNLLRMSVDRMYMV